MMKNKILKVLWIVCGMGFLGGVMAIMMLAYFSFGLPKISTLADYRPPLPTKILAKDGTVLAVLAKERRQVVTLDEIPKRVLDAFLSAEDDAFFQHTGVDYWGILRATFANVKAGKVVQGGSTITQQVAKSLLLTSERSIGRKIKDVLLARKIEKKFTKTEILFLYLNQVYLGGGYYGVKEAFEGYFGKSLNEATVAESAMIAGLLVAPGRYSPYVNPEYAKKRQAYVLGRMYATKKISEEEYQAALKENIRYRLRQSGEFKAGYFTDWVRQRVVAMVGEEELLTGGFKIMTTLDWELQQAAEREVISGAKAIDKRQGFKGPIKNLTAEEVDAFISDYRKQLLIEASNYFEIDENLKKKYEVNFTEEEFQRIKEYRLKWMEEFGGKKFVAGVAPSDTLLETLTVDKTYQAVVEKVDNSARLIYVNIGGVPGIINYLGFNWAHERTILEDQANYNYVTNPSTIVKPGDLVLVTVKRKDISAWAYAYSTFTQANSSYKFLAEAKKERFVLCELDQDPEVQAALFSISPTSGEVLAFVSGNDFTKTQFNRIVQSLRQPGSSFKPLIYAAALENGFTPSSIIIDSPEALGGADSNLNWKPRNYDGEFMGPMTLRRALELSRNVPAIKVAEKVTVPTIHKFAERIGFDAKIDPDLSLSLGSFGVSLKELVSAYSIFPNGGKIIDVKSVISIEDRDGNFYQLDENEKLNRIRSKQATGSETDATGSNEASTATKNASETKVNPFHINLGGDRVYDSRLAYVMTNLLRGVVLNGTGKAAREISTNIGGKTGTTNDYVDAWFIGFSATVATGVWTGFDDNKTLGWGQTGTMAALPIWKNYMKEAIAKFGESEFRIPHGIVHVMVDEKTGKLSKSRDNSYTEAFAEGTEPGEEGEFDPLAPTQETEVKGDLFEEEDYYNSN